MTHPVQNRRKQVRVLRSGGVLIFEPPGRSPTKSPPGVQPTPTRPSGSSLLFLADGTRSNDPYPDQIHCIFRPHAFLGYHRLMPGGSAQDEGGTDGQVRALLCGVFDCSPDLAAQIFMRGRLRNFPLRSVIVRQGDRVTTLYVIAAGRAHAIVYSLDGQIVLLHEYRSGDFFGVVSPP